MVWEFRGHSNLDDLHEHLRAFAIRREKAAVAPELPPEAAHGSPGHPREYGAVSTRRGRQWPGPGKNADALRMARGMALRRGLVPL